MVNIEKTKIRKGKVVCFFIAIMLFAMMAICVMFPPGKGQLPVFMDDNGEVVAGSISEKTYVEADGEKLGIFIIGKDKTKPVLLFLGGGPGIPEYLLEYEYPTEISNKFVVCYLDYRGTGRSYDYHMRADSMTMEQYISDTYTVTEYLKKRFGKEKIFLMGHSFGTQVGLETVYRYPDNYYAYIAMSQLTDQEQSEKLAYKYMLQQYRATGNSRMTKKLEKYPVLSVDGALGDYLDSTVRDEAMHDLGVGTTHKMKSVINGIFLPSLRCAVYTPIERITIWLSKKFISTSPVAMQRFRFNAFQEVRHLEVPIYFFAGKYDYTCAYELQKKYYDNLDAPFKAFYTFEESAHSPLFEEPDKAVRILKEDVLAGDSRLADQSMVSRNGQ